MSSNSGNPSKIAGQWHAAKGEVKHGLGRTFASSNLQQEGQQERQAGRSEANAAHGQQTDSSARYDGAGNDYGSGWSDHHDQQYGQQYGTQIDSGSTGNTTIPGTAAGSGPDTPLGGDNSSYSDDTDTTTTGTRNPRFNAFAPGGVLTGPGPERLQGNQPGQGNTAAQSRQAQQNMDEWNRNAF